MPTTPIPKKIMARQHEITADFTRLVEAHVADLVAGRATESLEIRDFAGQLCIHPTHLSNTLKLTTSGPPCDIYERCLLDAARALLRDTPASIAEVAGRLTYDPSNFTKFFKRFAGLTPRQYREQVYATRQTEKAEVVTK